MTTTRRKYEPQSEFARGFSLYGLQMVKEGASAAGRGSEEIRSGKPA